jgi:formate dehydrogenase subunit gamma
MTLTAEQTAIVESILIEHDQHASALLPVLHAVQSALGHVPNDSVSMLAQWLNLSRAEVHGVISFYSYFNTAAVGRHTLQICCAESCQAVGAEQLVAQAKQKLGVEFNQTSRDGNITLKPVYCLGNCACSPSVRVGDEIHGLINSEKLNDLIEQLSTDVVRIN